MSDGKKLKLPWVSKEHGVLRDAEDRQVGFCDYAVDVARRVNTHDDLLSALKRARVAMNRLGDVVNDADACDGDEHFDDTCKIFEEVNAAISRAEGRQS